MLAGTRARAGGQAGQRDNDELMALSAVADGVSGHVEAVNRVATRFAGGRVQFQIHLKAPVHRDDFARGAGVGNEAVIHP